MRTTVIGGVSNVGRVFTCLLLAMCLFSCSKDQEKSNDKKQQQKIQKLEPSDPVSVAKKFLMAMAKKDTEGALREVLPAQRSSLEKEFEKGFPPVPSEFELEIESMTEKEKAQVQMKGGEFGLDLRYKDGRWWIVK